MVYDRVFNSTYAKYKRAAGPRVNFAVPRRRANFMIPQVLKQPIVNAFDTAQQMGNTAYTPGAFQGAMNGIGNAFNGAKEAIAGIPSYLQGAGPSAGVSGIKNTFDGLADDAGDWLGSAGDAVGGAVRGAQDMITNGQWVPAEIAAAGAGALGAGVAGVRQLAKGGAGAADEVAEALPTGLRARIGSMSNGQKLGAGALAAGGIGAAGLGANALMRPDDEYGMM